MRRPYTPSPSIPTIETLRRARARLNRLRREVFAVLRAMKGGAALRFYTDAKTGDLWVLTTGKSVSAAAAVVVNDPRVTAVDFALLPEVPSATWRWIEDQFPPQEDLQT